MVVSARTIRGMLCGLLLPLIALVAIAAILAAGFDTRPFWNFVPPFAAKAAAILLEVVSWGHSVPLPFPTLFLSCFVGGYLAGHLNHGERKYLPVSVFVFGTAAIFAALDNAD